MHRFNLGSSIKSVDLNACLDGYLMLAKVTTADDREIYVNFVNKFDTVANGKHLTGYSLLRKQQL